MSKVIPLQFPAEGESGDYNVIGELMEVKSKLFYGSRDSWWATALIGSDLLLGEKKETVEGSAYQMREHRGQFVVSGAIAMYGRDCLAKA